MITVIELNNVRFCVGILIDSSIYILNYVLQNIVHSVIFEIVLC